VKGDDSNSSELLSNPFSEQGLQWDSINAE